MSYEGVRFQRVNLVVADLERSLAIYRDVLGLQVEYMHDSPPDSYSYPVFRFPRTAKLRFAALSAGPAQPRTLALTEVRGIALPKAPVPSLVATVLQCPALDETLAKLARVPGIEMIPEEVLRTHDGRVGREVAFVDPDGHLVVLYKIGSG